MAKTADMREVSLTKLKPYERNAKIHGDYQLSKLKDSIREFGFLTPCLIDRDYNLIAGHCRVMAAQQLGMETVPCVFVDGLTDAQRRAYILADNKLGELGEWDMDIVTDELTALADEDFDISLTGFNMPDEYPDMDELDRDGISSDELVVRLVFSDYKAYKTHESEIKDFADEIGCDLTVGK